MQTSPVIDQNLLVAYVRPVKEPMSEKTLKMLASASSWLVGLSILAFLVAIGTMLVQGWRQMTWRSYYEEFVPLAPWPVVFWAIGLSFAFAALGLWLVSRLGNVIEVVYRDVPQGMIVSKITRGGGEYPLHWVLVVKGFNSLNQIRTREYAVNAGKWHDEYRVGDYVDFRDEIDVANSLAQPLPEASVSWEM